MEEIRKATPVTELSMALSRLTRDEAREIIARASVIRKLTRLVVEHGESDWATLLPATRAHCVLNSNKFPPIRSMIKARLKEVGYKVVASKEQGRKKTIVPME